MNLLFSFFFYFFAMLVGLLPFPVLYAFSDFLSFISEKYSGTEKL